jgi:hypothetical protein
MVEFVSNRIMYIRQGGRWCNSILNVCAPPDDKSDDTKDSFYEELEHAFDQFLRYCMNFFL